MTASSNDAPRCASRRHCVLEVVGESGSRSPGHNSTPCICEYTTYTRATSPLYFPALPIALRSPNSAERFRWDLEPNSDLILPHKLENQNRTSADSNTVNSAPSMVHIPTHTFTHPPPTHTPFQTPPFPQSSFLLGHLLHPHEASRGPRSCACQRSRQYTAPSSPVP
jgi:hypothetical protein